MGGKVGAKLILQAGIAKDEIALDRARMGECGQIPLWLTILGQTRYAFPG